MISAIPALSSAPRSVVPSLVTMSCPTRAASSGSCSGSSTWRASPGSSIGAPSQASCTIGDTSAPLTSGVVSTCAMSPTTGAPFVPGEPGEDRGAVRQLGVEAELAKLLDEEPRELELLLRARPLRHAVGGLGVDPDVAEEPLEHVARELLRERARERQL